MEADRTGEQEGSERMQGMWEEEAYSDPDLPPANIQGAATSGLLSAASLELRKKTRRTQT